MKSAAQISLRTSITSLRWMKPMRDEICPEAPICLLWDGKKYWLQIVADKKEMKDLQYKFTFIKSFR